MTFEEMTALLPKGVVPRKGLNDIVAGAAVIKYAQGLASKIAGVMTRFREGDIEWDELESLRDTFSEFRWAYPIKLKQMQAEKCDRTRGMISGPLFTSARFPWPEFNERFMEPIAQFYLDEVGTLDQADLGEGLLQLWVGPGIEDYLIRIIPRSEISPEVITIPPAKIRGEYYEKSEFYAGEEAWPNKGCDVYQISGTSLRVLTWDSAINFAADEADFGERYGSDIEQDIHKFLSILPKKLPKTEPHFFGNFASIQFPISSMPRTLLALEGKPCFLWGDGGNAQIYFEKKAGDDPKFTFCWSCG